MAAKLLNYRQGRKPMERRRVYHPSNRTTNKNNKLKKKKCSKHIKQVKEKGFCWFNMFPYSMCYLICKMRSPY